MRKRGKAMRRMRLSSLVVSYHEAAHAVAAFSFGCRVREMYLHHGANGVCTHARAEDLEEEIIITLAGPIAMEKAAPGSLFSPKNKSHFDAIIKRMNTSVATRRLLNMHALWHQAQCIVERHWYEISFLGRMLERVKRLNENDIIKLYEMAQDDTDSS